MTSLRRLPARLSRGVVEWFAWVVPAWHRRRWRAEWHAELWHFEGWDADLVRRSAGAVRHALWLRAQEWRADHVLQDLKYALRSFGRSKAFAVIAVLTLAIGIGANTIVFGMVNALLIRPYPYSDPDRLVVVNNTEAGYRGLPVSLPDITDVRVQSQTLSDVAAWDWEPFNLRLADATHWVPSGRVTWSMFEVLGVRPIVGRTFREGEDRPDAPRVAVLGSGVWRDLFASDPGVVGRTVVLDGSPTEIIGVVPDYAAVPENSRLWVPLRIDPDESPRFAHWLNTIGRLAPGVSIAEANAELALVASRLEVEYPDTNEDRGFEVVALRDERSEDVASITLVLFGAVGFLLLIVCANVASLLLARASSREREIGIRAAIGASRTRLVRQLVTETLLLAGAGAVLGFGLSLLGTRAIVATVPGGLPPWMSVAPDARVLGFLLLVSLVAALAAGLAPAWKASRPDLRTAISGGLRGGDRRTTQRGRRALVAAELAVSVTLLIGAGLLVRSFVRLTSVEPGFTTENRLTARMALPRGKYDSEAKRIEFVRDMSEQIRAVPGVREVAVVDRMPLGGSSNRMTVFVEGQTREEFDNNPAVLVNVAGPGYFTAMGIPRLRGRGILATDDSASARVAVISEDMADRLWPGEDPIGRRFTFSDPPEWIEVVGVVGGVRHHGLDDRPIPHAYLAYAQNASTRMSVVIRAAGEPSTLVAAVREAIRRADSDVAPADEMPLTELVEASTWQAGFFTRLFWVFGLIALILAAVGVYGVVSFAVAQRTREFGIRRALGAETHRLLRLVLRDAGVVVLIGLLLGLAGSLALSRVLAGFLYEISPTDPLTFAAVAGFLAATALLAAWMPARRASRVDPIVALREE